MTSEKHYISELDKFAYTKPNFLMYIEGSNSEFEYFKHFIFDNINDEYRLDDDIIFDNIDNIHISFGIDEKGFGITDMKNADFIKIIGGK